MLIILILTICDFFQDRIEEETNKLLSFNDSNEDIRSSIESRTSTNDTGFASYVMDDIYVDDDYDDHLLVDKTLPLVKYGNTVVTSMHAVSHVNILL